MVATNGTAIEHAQLFWGFTQVQFSQLFAYISRCFAYISRGFHAGFTLFSRAGFVYVISHTDAFAGLCLVDFFPSRFCVASTHKNHISVT